MNEDKSRSDLGLKGRIKGQRKGLQENRETSYVGLFGDRRGSSRTEDVDVLHILFILYPYKIS